MGRDILPLKEVSIEKLYISGEKAVYEIPIYQRNYAWEKDEISTLIQDVYDAYKKDRQKVYYIGTLVSYHKGDCVYEIIDGQQRLTTIRLILAALEIESKNQLTYRARKRSDATLKAIPDFDIDETDAGIKNGYEYAKSAIGDIVPADEKSSFTSYFKSNVHIIHYQVPKDIDLNHYFEIMNSRGEQLEKHEIVKANLMEKLETDEERRLFNKIWECCSEMSIYVQQNVYGLKSEAVFGRNFSEFIPKSFEEMMSALPEKAEEIRGMESISIFDIIHPQESGSKWVRLEEENDKKDSFQPIIDFPNFLLIVLKISKMSEQDFQPTEFLLDDKELLYEFTANEKMDAAKVRSFAYNLMKARFLLDNYMIHHSKEEDTIKSNPWKLQVWHKDEETKKGQLKNLSEDESIQNRLVHLLSMFEVSFTAKQRKNYLFYCLFYLMKEKVLDVGSYEKFVKDLADRYFVKVYLDDSKLNAINTPVPGSFDETILKDRELDNSVLRAKNSKVFTDIYGDGTKVSKGVPLFIFNYLDYKIWEMYDVDLRGKNSKEGCAERKRFFFRLGCSDFGLDLFKQFYFSRTRRSLEHYYPQSLAVGKEEPAIEQEESVLEKERISEVVTDAPLNQNQINCIGNYAMIGSGANSSGSNWTPKTKLDHYLDDSRKINQISVASLKFMVMMQVCKDRQTWGFKEIKEHQEKMLDVLLGKDRY